MNPHEKIQSIVDQIDKFAYLDAKLTALETYKSAIKAIEMKNSSQPSIAGKEMDALASDAFLGYIEQLEDIKRQHTAMKLTIETAKISIEVWRSEQATNRTIDKITR